MKRTFYYQPKYNVERLGNYEKQKAIVSKWEFTKKRNNGCGNVNSSIYLDPRSKKIRYEDSGYRNDSLVPMYKLISPALAMYRLVCMFFQAPICYDGYKTVWEYNLIHIESNEQISLSEWKGAFGVRTRFSSYKEVPESLTKDLFDLIGHLISDECAHPYDELTAGSVA